MTCPELADLLLDYVAGHLSPEDDERMQQHMDSCPRCLHLTVTYHLTIRITRQLPPAAMPPETAERLQAAVQAATPPDV